MTAVSRKRIIISCVLICSAVFIARGAGSAGAEEKAHVTTIVVQDMQDGISPAAVTVKRGDTVVWYNQGKAPAAISVKQRIGIVCSPLVNFNADPAGNYKTGALPHGSTASLCFLFPGEYHYTVRWMNAKGDNVSGETVAGKVIVK